MPIDNIDNEMKQVKATAAAAFKAFDEEDFVTSAKQLELSAQKLKQVYSVQHPDVLKCMLFSGDSYFYLDRFGDAAKAYLELQSIVESSDEIEFDRSVFYFKIAKTLEKAKRINDAEKAYAKALSVSERTLSPNHPLLTIVMESYASFLRHIRKNPTAAVPLEEKAAALREKNKEIAGLYENYLEPLKRRAHEPIRSADLHAKVGVKKVTGETERREPSESGRPAKSNDPLFSEITLFLSKIGAVLAIIVAVIWSINFFGGRGMTAFNQNYMGRGGLDPQSGGKSKNLIVNGGFDEWNQYEYKSGRDPFLENWTKVKTPIEEMTNSRGPLPPSDGYRYVSLGLTGQIEQPLHLTEGRHYVLTFDVATSEPDEHPAIIYSLDSVNWRNAYGLGANTWTTETYRFVATAQTTRLCFASGYHKGTKDRFLDKVCLRLDE